MFDNKNKARLKLVSKIPPSVNHYLKYRTVKRGNSYVAMSYKDPVTVKYKKEFSEYVCNEVENQGWSLGLNKYQHFYVDVVFYFDREDMDPNNYYKVMLDAITDTQLIWADDNVANERTLRVYYDTSNPRMEITIYPVDYIGIFDDASQLDEFVKSNCVGCIRKDRNCSIFKNATKGKIQEDTDNINCSKRRVKKN